MKTDVEEAAEISLALSNVRRWQSVHNSALADLHNAEKQVAGFKVAVDRTRQTLVEAERKLRGLMGRAG